MNSGYTYSMRLVVPFLRQLRTYPQISDELLQPLVEMDLESRLPVDVLHELLSGAIAMTGDPLIGLKAAAKIERGDYGALEYAASTAATSREALEVIARYLHLVNDGLQCSIEVDGDRAIVRLVNAVFLPPAAEDFELASFFWTMRLHNRQNIPFDAYFTQAAPADVSSFIACLPSNATVHFGCGWSGFSFAAEHLQNSVPVADPKLHELLRSHADHLLQALPKPRSLADRVGAYLMVHLQGASATLSATARELHMSERTLARRLEQEGTSFSQLLEQTRRQLAMRYVEHSDLALSEVAFLLGFSQVSAFHRAFKRWTQTTPLEHRARARGVKS